MICPSSNTGNANVLFGRVATQYKLNYSAVAGSYWPIWSWCLHTAYPKLKRLSADSRQDN